MIAAMLLSLCLSTASDTLQIPSWQLKYLAPSLAVSCERNPYGTMAALRGVPVWPR